MSLRESQIEQKLINKLEDLKYTYRPDVRDKVTLEQNFRDKFEALNHVRLTDAEFARLRDEIITADVFQAARALREYGYFEREDGTPLHYMLVNLKDWCKNNFEVTDQLRINTGNSHHCDDVILLINFDESHRAQFGDSHQAIMAFFPQAQLFGFTGTPIFCENASYKHFDGTVGSYRAAEDVFVKQLHAYTITHALTGCNVLRFHIDCFKPKAAQINHTGESSHRKLKVQSKKATLDQAVAQRAMVKSIVA